MTKAKPKRTKKEAPKIVQKNPPTHANKIIRDVGRFHLLAWGGGQVTIPKDMTKNLNLDNKDKIMIEGTPDKITITKLNP